jgi:hypothetical protein
MLLRVLTGLISVLLAAISVWSLGHTAVEMLDPCMRWEPQTGPGFQGHASIEPNSPCRGVTVSGQSRRQAITVALLVPGGVLGGTLLAGFALLRARRRLMIGAGVILLLETLVVFTIAPLTLAAAIVYFFAASRLPPAAAV